MRLDNRPNNALRPVVLQKQFTRYAEGSVLISVGHTKVLCNASVLEKVPPHQKGSGQGWVTAEYSMLPRATHSRSEREVKKGKPSGRTEEIQRLIGRSLRAAVDLSLLGERTIHLDCDVIQADGGTRTAAITGAFVALRDAVSGLIAKGALTQNPIKNQIAAISVGVIGGEVRLDLNYEEDSSCDADVNVVINNAGGIIEIQGTAEGAAFSNAQLNELLSYAQNGIAKLFAIQNQ